MGTISAGVEHDRLFILILEPRIGALFYQLAHHRVARIIVGQVDCEVKWRLPLLRLQSVCDIAAEIV